MSFSNILMFCVFIPISFCLILFINILATALNNACETKIGESYLYLYNIGGSVNQVLIPIIISGTNYMFNIVNTDKMMLLIGLYLLILLLVKITFVKKIKINIISDELILEDKNKVKSNKNEFTLRMYFDKKIKNKKVVLDSNIFLELNRDNELLGYINLLSAKTNKVLLSNIITCNNIKYEVNNEVIADFDKAFIKMIKDINLDYSSLMNNMEYLKEFYENINPSGNFDYIRQIF